MKSSASKITDSGRDTRAPDCHVPTPIHASPVDRAEKWYCDVQWQSGGSDCGIFALAFATSLCSGQDPTTTSYDQVVSPTQGSASS